MRLDDWDQRLSQAFADARRREFDGGAHDCALHAADCIEAVTGRDVAADWRGRYATQEAGLKLAKARSLAALAARFFPEIPPVFAHRGDVAIALAGELRRGRRTPMLFVVDGVFLRGPAGVAIPRGEAVRAWRVE